MDDLITVQGIVLSAMPVGDYDRRIVLLTRERGKIAAFAKGARRPKSPFLAATSPFVFGSFTLYEGRTSYNLQQVNVTHYFSELAMEQPGVYYGYYFLELADYFGQENTDEKESMNLLYVTVKALLNNKLENRLVRCIYELRMLQLQGYGPSLYGCACCETEPQEGEELFFSIHAHGILDKKCLSAVHDAGRISPGTLYAMRYITGAPMGKLYTFTVNEDILHELERYIRVYTADIVDKRFKSLDILEVMEKQCRV